MLNPSRGISSEPIPFVKLLLEQHVPGESDLIRFQSRLNSVSRRLNFDDSTRERMRLVTAEIATNQAKYAKGRGCIQAWQVQDTALDLFGLDYGPGISDLALAMQDGNSTAGTLGKGLGAISRLAHHYGIYTLPDGVEPEARWHGTAIWARFYGHNKAVQEAASKGIYVRAYQDDFYNGDKICLQSYANSMRWIHLDALGHGKEAAETVARVCEQLDSAITLLETLERLDRFFTGGRGAVAILGEANAVEGTITVGGVGDMQAHMFSGGQKQNVAFSPGILGHTHGSFQLTRLPWSPGSFFATASDGMRSGWGTAEFPGLSRQHPQMIAYVL